MSSDICQLNLLERHTAGVSFLNDVRGCLDILSDYLGAIGYALVTFQTGSERQPADGGTFSPARVIYSTLDESHELRYVHLPLRNFHCDGSGDRTGPYAMSWSPLHETYSIDGAGAGGQAAVREPSTRCIAVPDAARNFAAVVLQDPSEVADIAKNAVWHSFGTRLAKHTLKLAEPASAHNLSDREKQCLLWCSRGKTSSDIASILGLSDHTVNHYLTSAALKLNAVNRTHAIAKALRYGIIPLHDL